MPADPAALATARAAYQAMPSGVMPNYSDDGFAQWWAANMGTTDISQYPQDMALLSALADNGNATATQALTAGGYQPTSTTTTTVPLEKGILDTILPGLQTQITNDQKNQQLVDDLSKQTTDAYGNLKTALAPAVATVNPDGSITSPLYQAQTKNADATTAALIAAAKTANASNSAALATSIQAQQQALSQQMAALQGDASQAATDKRAALQTQIAGLTAAAAPLAAARSAAAQDQVTGVNLGLQQTQDQIKAKNAANGYIGGSSMEDANLARASIDARQNAAGAVGAANVANATDMTNIGNLGANSGYSIADALATQTQGIGDQGATGNAALQAALAQGNYSLAAALSGQTQQAQNQGAAAKATYFDQIFPNSVSAAQALAGMPAAEAQNLQNIIPLGTAGTNNALNTLNWWATNTPPPTPTTTIGQPSTTGNGIAQLGAGLLGSAFQTGNANNWWQTPKVTTGPGGAPANTDLTGVTTTIGTNFCWVAREIYGEKDSRWLRFRDWLITKASSDLQEIYLRAGDKLAAWLRTNGTPEIRASIRSFMDRQIDFA